MKLVAKTRKARINRAKSKIREVLLIKLTIES